MTPEDIVKIDQLAKITHEAVRAFSETCGDHSSKRWEETDEEIKNSVRSGVKFLLVDSQATPKDSHKEWLRFKVEQGWVFGETKDSEAKTHPCLLPYDKLSIEDRFKDTLFYSIIRGYESFCVQEDLREID